jgi:hypothetical protein
MEHDLFRFDEPYARPRRRTNVFAWTVAILLLTGLAFAAWIGSLYIFGQPERPDSYRILKKLHKIEQPKRFELTAAPAGEFLNPKQIYDRFIAMRPAELGKFNGELARNYIRNFQQVRGLVPYVVGRFNIMEARELGPNDIFTSGMVAISRADDLPELLMEHLYPADVRDAPLMKQTLVMGLDVRLEKTHDLSAIIHAERLPDGRLQITAIPLLYGTYTVSRGTGTFTLEPPLDLNLAAGWPIFKESMRRMAEIHYDSYRERLAPKQGGVPIAGIAPSAAPAAPTNELVRVEPASAVAPPKAAAATPAAGKSTPPVVAAKGGKAKGSPAPVPSPPPAAVAVQKPPAPPATATPAPTVVAAAAKSPPPTAAPIAQPSATVAVAAASVAPPAGASPVQVLPAIPVTGASPGTALASTAGGATWKTFEPGQMPAGRLVGPTDLKEIADQGTGGERIYLKGQFVVNFTDANRAVLRPRTNLTDRVLHFGGSGKSTRIIVDFPAGYTPPQAGSVVNRDEARPYEVTEVRQQSDGQINVFVREIMR